MIRVTDTKPILGLARQGYSALEIKKALYLPITTRQIQRIVKREEIRASRHCPACGQLKPEFQTAATASQRA